MAVKPAEIPDPERKRSCEEWAASESADTDLMLDFSEYLADDTEVIGLPISALKWNRDLHFSISLRGRDPEEWDSMGLPADSFWSTRMRRLHMFGAREGVFSCPLPNHRRYAQALEERSKVVEARFVSPAHS